MAHRLWPNCCAMWTACSHIDTDEEVDRYMQHAIDGMVGAWCSAYKTRIMRDAISRWLTSHNLRAVEG